MTGSYLRWIPFFLGFLLLTAPLWGARAGDAYKPTPAAASPAKSSKSSDNVDAVSDDSTMDVSDEPAEGAEPAPPKTTHPRPARRNAATNPTDASAGGDAQGVAQTPAEKAEDPDRAARALWEEKARKADERVAAAQARLDQAELAYTNMRMRSYPGGDARAALIKEVEDAKAELSAAQAER
ncbi:MAG TPA: hypothetical protein DEP35_12615, partial [Deltaproteobacteria bacterium]|nr:hypothetical protein [Deltaproteobacteria bacterium]